MADYICEFEDEGYGASMKRQERVVRCQDCDRALNCEGGDIWCMKHHTFTDLFGYCKWGEEREA